MNTPPHSSPTRLLVQSLFEILFFPLLILLFVIILILLPACSSQIGPSISTHPDGTIESRNSSGLNHTTLARSGETWSSESTVPGSYTEMYDRRGNAVAALGPRSRLMIVPWFGEEMKLASDTDITISVADASMPDGTHLKNLTFSTQASPVILAQNESLDRLKDVLISRDAHAAEVLLADREAIKHITDVLGPGILLVLRSIAGV